MDHLILTKFIRETSMEAIHSNCGAAIPAGMIMVKIEKSLRADPGSSVAARATGKMTGFNLETRPRPLAWFSFFPRGAQIL